MLLSFSTNKSKWFRWQLCIVVFLIIFIQAAYSQTNYVLISKSQIPFQKLLNQPDSIKTKIVRSVSAKLILKTQNQSADIFKVDVSHINNDTLVLFPDYLRHSVIVSVTFEIILQPIALEYRQDFIKYGLDNNSIKHRVVFPNRGGAQAIGLPDNQDYYSTTMPPPNYCILASIPDKVNADVYFIRETEWQINLHYPSPPVSEKLTPEMIQKVKNRSLGNFATGVQMQKEDRPYIIIIDHKGIYTAVVVNPYVVERQAINVR